MEVIGRQDELQVIGSFLEFVVRGPVALVLRGEAGIGKTTLWEAGLDQAEKRGYTVLACRAAQSEARLSYSSVCDLLAGVDEQTLGRLPAPQREALEVVLLRSEKPNVTVDQRSIATAFLTVLSQLAQGSPVVLAVDDFQWADRTSAQAIEFATRRMTGRIGVLASIRASQGADERAIRLAHPDAVRQLDMVPMSLGAIHNILRERTGRTFPRPTLVRIHEVSGGNPFFALEIAQVLGDGSVLGPQTRFPATLAQLTRTRLEGLDTDVGEALLAAAALASPSIEVLDRVLGCDSYKLLERAEELGILQLTGNHIRFTHPILASGTYAMASPAKRRAMHRRLAGVVLDIEERAHHLALAAVGPEPEAIAALDAAAANASKRGAPAAGAELLDLAVQLGGGDPSRCVTAARFHFDAGDPARARKLLEGVIPQIEPGDLRAEALRVLAAVGIHDDTYDAAAALLEEGLREVTPDSALGVRIELELTFALYNLGRLNEALAHSDAAVTGAERLGVPGLIARALAMSAVLRFLAGDRYEQSALNRALALEDIEEPMTNEAGPSMIAGLIHMWSGRLKEAHDVLTRLRKNCVDSGAESDLVFIGFHLETLECWCGNLEAAKAVASEMHVRALQLGTREQVAIALSARAHSSAFAGEVQSARRDAEECFAILSQAKLATVALVPMATLGFIEISLDDFEAAANRLAPMVMGAITVGVREPSVVPFAPDAAEALIRVNRLGESEEVINWLEAHGRRLDRAWAVAAGGRCRSLLLAAQGQLEAAIGCCQQALVEHQKLTMPFEHARTLLVLGQLQRRHGKRRDARSSLGAALEIFTRLGTVLWAEKARRELARLGMQPGKPSQLTPSELRVAELAGAGQTNRQVAAALHISPKTVEANLARIYQKLDIRSRAELGRVMAEGAVDKGKPNLLGSTHT